MLECCSQEKKPDAVHRCASSFKWNDEKIVEEDENLSSVAITAGVGNMRRWRSGEGSGQVLLDCGASDCMTGDKRFVTGKMAPLQVPIRSADKSSVLKTAGVGPGCIRVGNGDIKVPKIYFVPGIIWI